MIYYNGYKWEIASILMRHDGIFYFIRRREGKAIIIREVIKEELLRIKENWLLLSQQEKEIL
jgi:hypothetical protein